MTKFSKRRQAGHQEESSLSLDDALRLFLLSQGGLGHSNITSIDYKCAINLFLRYIRSEMGYSFVNEIKEEDILVWLSHLRETPSRLGRPFSSRSILAYYRDVRVFFNWLAEHGHVEVNPFAELKSLKVDKTLIRIFTEQELQSMDAACNRSPEGRSLTPDERKALAARDRAFLWLLLSTGIRLSEACGLLFSDVDWKEGMIYVRGKGAKERHIPFGKVAQQHLDTYVRYWRGVSPDKIKPGDHVFLSAYGDPLRTSAAYRIFVRIKKIAGITDKRVSPHTCRHWFAVNAIKNGMPTVVLKNILEHENWDMIEVYVRLAEQDVRQSYGRFSPVDALEMHQHPKGKRQELRQWRMSRKQGKDS
jgi:site-specific recombinase XerD